MSQFCKKCLKKALNLDPDPEHPEWIVEWGYICEECGYKYMEEKEEEK